ncbi:hypothetical protein ACIRU8_39815 [Streptomyces sp. NPDC101175]|uniref:hypothetical protein n=1 Tax=Streptomyces sp. NPDC101175 TaxID=3366123 RepID=UPI003833CFAA
MEERRDEPPPAVTRPPVIASGAGTLSPLQQAYSNYVRHATACDRCRDLDGGACETAGELWRAYQAIGDDTYRRMPR